MNEKMNEIINENTTFDDIDELDSTWIQEFENLDNDYKNYYTLIGSKIIYIVLALYHHLELICKFYSREIHYLLIYQGFL